VPLTRRHIHAQAFRQQSPQACTLERVPVWSEFFKSCCPCANFLLDARQDDRLHGFPGQGNEFVAAWERSYGALFAASPTLGGVLPE
jgi:hypothetical protein